MSLEQALADLSRSLRSSDGLAAALRTRLLLPTLDSDSLVHRRTLVPVLDALVSFLDRHNEHVRISSLDDVGRELALALRGIGELRVDDVHRLDHMTRADLARLQRLVCERLDALQRERGAE